MPLFEYEKASYGVMKIDITIGSFFVLLLCVKNDFDRLVKREMFRLTTEKKSDTVFV